MVNKKLSLALQAQCLKNKYPDSNCELKGNKLLWYGLVKPTPLSKTYKIKLICDHNKTPEVYLVGKDIEGIERKDFPHRFGICKHKKQQEVKLCLYYGNKEFDNTKRFSDTLIPWAQEWLLHYEIWLVTNKWCGGGHGTEWSQS